MVSQPVGVRIGVKPQIRGELCAEVIEIGWHQFGHVQSPLLNVSSARLLKLAAQGATCLRRQPPRRYAMHQNFALSLQ